MSYSFGVRGTNKADALAKIAAGFDEIIAAQPCHVRDQLAVLATAAAYLDLLAEDETMDVSVTISGSVSYPWTQVDPNGEHSPLTAASIGVSVCHVAKQ